MSNGSTCYGKVGENGCSENKTLIKFRMWHAKCEYMYSIFFTLSFLIDYVIHPYIAVT